MIEHYKARNCFGDHVEIYEFIGEDQGKLLKAAGKWVTKHHATVDALTLTWTDNGEYWVLDLYVNNA